jgi:hypothetical protein
MYRIPKLNKGDAVAVCDATGAEQRTKVDFPNTYGLKY